MKNLSIILVMILLSSCEQWMVDKLPTSPNEIIVVNALLSPQDSLITVYVGKGSNLIDDNKFNKDLSRVDAKVELSDGGQTIILPYNSQTKVYQVTSSNFMIQSNLGL